MATKTRCRALVAGFGRPGMRDLDVGRQLVRYLEARSWPEDVVVEDLSYAAPLVLHRLQELDPAKVVLVGAVARGYDAPGALRRYRVDPGPPPPREVQRSLEESVQGVVDLDHTLAVARHWGSLPAETVVIEVEPADCSFGLGFSEELAAAFDPVVAMILDEVGGPDVELDCGDALAAPAAEAAAGGDPAAASPRPCDVAPSEELMALVRLADDRRRTALLHAHRAGQRLGEPIDGLVVAGRSRPWGVNLEAGSDWFDVIALDDGWVGVAIGDVPGRGAEAAGAMADLRTALRAYAVVDGRSPARVLGLLDGLARATGTGLGATVVYGALHPRNGELRLSNAGHCPPLLASAGEARFLWQAREQPLGCASAPRPEATLPVTAGATVVLFTDGLVQARGVTMGAGLDMLRRAATDSTGSLEDLCDRLLEASPSRRRRDDDITLLALRLAACGLRETA